MHFFLAVALRVEVRGGLDLQGAIDAPNWHNDSSPGSVFPRGMRPGSVTVEERMGPVVVEEARRRGHDVTVGDPWPEGRICAVARDPETGVLSAAANPPRHAGISRRSLTGHLRVMTRSSGSRWTVLSWSHDR